MHPDRIPPSVTHVLRAHTASKLCTLFILYFNDIFVNVCLSVNLSTYSNIQSTSGVYVSYKI